MSVYRTNPDAPPDSNFEPGAFHHLVAGNAGRLLDPRRTPVSIVAVRRETGTFVVRIDSFEDEGATWDIPFEDVTRYQFERDAKRASPETVTEYRSIAARLDRPLVIACDPDVRAATLERLRRERAAADAWLATSSRFLADGDPLPEPEPERRGDERLWSDLERFMRARNVWDVEHAFAKQYVSGPHSGEVVRGHRIVLAELGLVPYDGKAPRDPAVFEGTWARERRREHTIARLAFVHALYHRLHLDEVVLYRGMSVTGPLQPPRNRTFVSASFSRLVAEGHFDAGGPGATRVLSSQAVPVERLFMTFHETAAMNASFLEAEAVLMWDERNTSF